MVNFLSVADACDTSELLACREADQQLFAVGLNFCLVCCTVAMDLTAFRTAMNDHKALFGVGLGADRLHLPLAGVCAVTGVDVHVE